MLDTGFWLAVFPVSETTLLTLEKGTGKSPPPPGKKSLQKAPHNEIIIQS
jgi:hypothetical protein